MKNLEHQHAKLKIFLFTLSSNHRMLSFSDCSTVCNYKNRKHKNKHSCVSSIYNPNVLQKVQWHQSLQNIRVCVRYTKQSVLHAHISTDNY